MGQTGNCLSSFFLLPSGSSRRPDVGGLPREAQFFEQALAGFLVTVVDVAEILLGQVQLACELGQRLVTLDALHDGDQLFDGRRFVCHTGIHCIPISDTLSNARLGTSRWYPTIGSRSIGSSRKGTRSFSSAVPEGRSLRRAG